MTLLILSSAIDNAAELLEPILTSIYKKMGLVSTLLLAGPIPDQGGQIRVKV